MKIGNILAAGLAGILAASCADNTCHIEGVVESAQAGDTLLFARMNNDTFVPTDTLILDEGGKFTVNEPCDSTIIASYFFYDKQSQEAYSNVFFIESGKVSMRIGPDGKVSGTENNDLYQALTDSIYGLHEQMNAIYSMEPKDSMGMPLPSQEAENRLIALEQQASQLLEENVRKHIGKPLGYFLLLSCYDMFEPKEILELAEKVSADYQNIPALQHLKEEAVKSNATANGQTFIDVTMPSMDGGELKLSEVIKATALDSLTDCLATLAALIAVIVSRFAGVNIDGYMGIFVALFIAFAGVGIFRDTIGKLLGEAPDPEIVQKIRNRIFMHGGVHGIHDLMVHSYGHKYYATVHVEVDSKMPMMEGHDLADTIERDFACNTDIVLVVHLDPVVLDNPKCNACRVLVEEIVKEIDPSFSVHDFRMVDGISHTNLIFDVAIPFECKLSPQEVKDEISRRVRERDKKLFAVPTVEPSISTE